MSSTITIRVSSKFKKELERVCKENDLKMSKIVRDSLNRIAAIYQFDLKRKKVLTYAEKAGLFTDEDIFNLPS